MIHLCYLKEKTEIDEVVISIKRKLPKEPCTFIAPLGFYSMHKFLMRINDNLFDGEKINFEELQSIKPKYLFLLQFDYFAPSFIRRIISLFAKKSEILGITNDYNMTHLKIKLDIQEQKNIGLNKDQLSLFLSLKYDLPYFAVDMILSKDDTKTNHLEIDTIEELDKFLP